MQVFFKKILGGVDMGFLTTSEFAQLKGCTDRYVKKLIKEGKLVADVTLNDRNRPKYLIPISALSEELQQKYTLQLKAAENTAIVPVQKELPVTVTKIKRDIGSFTADEREVISFWCDTLREWRIRRKEYSSLEEGDTVFIAELKRLKKELMTQHNITVSRDILYRKYKYFKNEDWAGLAELRGGSNKGRNSIAPELEKVFYDLYLHDSEPTISECCRLTFQWAADNRPDLAADMPSDRTFRRAAERLPEAVVKYFRCSVKECIDECLPYIIRLYDDIEANDVWVADNHTFDFVTKTNDGQKNHRLYITGILDAKTGVLVGWNITENPCSQSTVLALRHAIMRCGIPKVLYVDNGTEFLTHDIGGKGHRARKSQRDIPNPPTILDHLGIKMVNALVCNGRAKPIERMFLTLKNTISRIVGTYTGGNVTERPESLKWQLKHGVVPYDWQIKEKLDVLLDGYNGSPYGGCEPQFKSMTRAEAWCTSIKRRTLKSCSESALNLMLMRTTRYQKVRENGVYITISGEKLWYNCGVDNWRYVGQEVYVRYDPADLETVRVYDKQDRYMADWCLDTSVFVDYITVDTDDIADRQRLIGRQLRAIREYGKELTGDMQIDALALAVAEAHRKTGNIALAPPEDISKECIEINEAIRLPKAAGSDNEEVDLVRMIANASKRITDFERD